jgi:hypothetical protein
MECPFKFYTIDDAFFFTFIGSWTMLGSNMLKAYHLDWNKNNKPLRQM